MVLEGGQQNDYICPQGGGGSQNRLKFCPRGLYMAPYREIVTFLFEVKILARFGYFLKLFSELVRTPI